MNENEDEVFHESKDQDSHSSTPVHEQTTQSKEPAQPEEPVETVQHNYEEPAAIVDQNSISPIHEEDTTHVHDNMNTKKDEEKNVSDLSGIDVNKIVQQVQLLQESVKILTDEKVMRENKSTFQNQAQKQESSQHQPVHAVSTKENEIMNAIDPEAGGMTRVTSKGRLHLDTMDLHMEHDDPWLPIFKFIDWFQELALPFLIGTIIALVWSNLEYEDYDYYLGACLHADFDDDYGYSYVQRNNISDYEMGVDDHYGYNWFTDMFKNGSAVNKTHYDHHHELGCSPARYLLTDCLVFGHPITIHFITNDLVMVFHFALAMKEVVHALLPGGSLNPPKKAINVIFATMGGVFGPIIVYFVLLVIFWHAGAFDPDTYPQYSKESFRSLASGWGIATATDIVLAWPVARIVFGDGHPAIDYLLLVAVTIDGIGLIIIECFYPDPNYPFEEIWLWLVVAGMVIAFLLRKWHFRVERVYHQNWEPYVIICGTLCWVGLIKAHLHPSLALCYIVPFMPGPDQESLESFDNLVEKRVQEILVAKGLAIDNDIEKNSEEPTQPTRGRGISIQSGLYAGLLGHDVDKSLKVKELDEDGNEKLHASTLDSFESFWAPVTDFGLFGFAMANAGTDLTKVGSMTALIVLSLLIGKTLGVFGMYKFASAWGFLPPVGVHDRHMYMIGLICSIGLIVALLLSEYAYPKNETLQAESKIGALITGFIALVALGIAQMYDFKNEDFTAEEMDLKNEDQLGGIPLISCCGGYSLSLVKAGDLQQERQRRP